MPAPPAVRPRRITLGAGGVRGAGIVERDPGRDGALAPPAAADIVGWYADGPQPGEAGAALLVGPADADAGAAPAVFRSLTGVRPGERVEIRRSDGSTVRSPSRTSGSSTAATSTSTGPAPYVPAAVPNSG
ncbi:hypothetical protein [Streptomyces lydicus]|uniref:hypothetical protein n=1 Tax=Streptomyces lydicus TaxID=47763 RepID=UPI003789E5E8